MPWEIKLHLSPVCEEFVEKELLGLNPSKSTGLDNIPTRFLNNGASVLKDPLAHIISLSITSGMYQMILRLLKSNPSSKKRQNKTEQKPKPKPKTNKQTDVANYRPTVSILNIVSKVLKKAVYTQFESHLVQNKLLYDYQSGFRQSFSTDSCLIPF